MTKPEAGIRVLSWADFGKEAPHLEAFGCRRLERRIAYLATIRADGSPRVHPVSPFIGDGCLAVYMEPTSLKSADLRRDGRYSLHCAVEDNEGGEGEFLRHRARGGDHRRAATPRGGRLGRSRGLRSGRSARLFRVQAGLRPCHDLRRRSKAGRMARRPERPVALKADAPVSVMPS
jgi:hypothetical protein